MQPAELLREIGGPAGCRALSEAFYSRVQSDPVLGPFFPGASLRCAIEELSAFLVQLLAGPAEATQKRWWVSLRESHMRFRIGPEAREAWMANMRDTLEGLRLQPPAHEALRQMFENLSAHVVNASAHQSRDREGAVANQSFDLVVAPPSGGSPSEARTGSLETSRASACGADAPIRAGRPRPAGEQRSPSPCDHLAHRQHQVDTVVAEVRAGHIEQAIELAEASAYIQSNPAVLAALLGLMLTAGLTAYVRTKLERDPALATTRYSGRTLLHTAAGAGDLATVELLLRLGAPSDVLDDGGHTPLYSVANECGSPGGPPVVRALIRAGADVNACDGSKRCTPLHMAARRGHEEIAAALLACRARLDPRDILGDTPLRRAVNCNKPGVAALLASHGANLTSVGSKGLTPKSAARTASMRAALQNQT